MADNNGRNFIDADDKQQFRKSLREQGLGDTARVARSFARPQKPVSLKPARPESAPQETVRLPSADSGNGFLAQEQAATHTRRMRPVEAETESRRTALNDRTKRQHAVKPPEQVQTVKVSSDAKVPLRGAPKSKQEIKVAARNRQAAEMESIFRHEARMTELPRSRSYFSRIFRLKRNGPAKIYRLKGYANREYVKQRRKRSRRNFKRANLLFWIIVAVIFLVIFYWLNPIDKIQELMHLFGM